MKKAKTKPQMSWQEAKDRDLCRFCEQPWSPGHVCYDLRLLPKNKLKFLKGGK